MIVCKVGGSEGIDLDAVCDDVAALIESGTPLILVHGGSHETNRVAEALGTPPKFITSPSGYTSRHTDRKTIEIFEMVYCGSVNKGIVERLQTRGVNAVGLSGLDGRLWQGPRKKAIRAVENGKVRVVRDSYTGVVERVNTDLLRSLIDGGMFPVLTPPALSNEGEAINVDGDRAAAATAAALGADALLLLSNVPGLLSNFPDESSLVRELSASGLDDAIEMAEGRMRIKLRGAGEALAGGVGRVVIGDARSAEPIRRAIDGAGDGDPLSGLDDPVALLREMVAIDSPSREEATLAAYLVERMSTVGFQARLDEVGNAVGVREGAPPTDGAWREIVLLGHMDVVPGAVPRRTEGDLLYGRGSVDAKGPLATFIAASAAVTPADGARIVVIGAVEEEISTSRGAHHVKTKRRPDACIIGEPSGWDAVTLGYKGCLKATYRLEQPGGHGAGPQGAIAEQAVDFWNRVAEHAASYNADRSRLFEQLMPSLMRIETTSDGLSDMVDASLGFRLPPDFDLDAFEGWLRAEAGPAELEVYGAEPAWSSPRTTPLARGFVRALRQAGAAPRFKHKTGTSDMNVVGPAWGCPIVAYGPGDSQLDHTPNEHVSISEYMRAIDVLGSALRDAGFAREST